MLFKISKPKPKTLLSFSLVSDMTTVIEAKRVIRQSFISKLLYSQLKDHFILAEFRPAFDKKCLGLLNTQLNYLLSKVQ